MSRYTLPNCRYIRDVCYNEYFPEVKRPPPKPKAIIPDKSKTNNTTENYISLKSILLAMLILEQF